MIDFKAFQNLYQHIKKDDPRLFETLDRLANYEQQLSKEVNGLNLAQFNTPRATLATAAGQALTGAMTNATGLNIVLRTSGTWMITAHMAFQQFFGDTIMQARLMIGAVAQVPIIQINDGALVVTQSSIVNASQVWLYNSPHGNDIINIQVDKAAGAAASTVLAISQLVAFWYPG